jgi:hypothetical protein
MSIPQNRLSDTPHVGAYLPPDDITHTLNEDWEAGPIGLNNTAQGLAYQDWHLEFGAGQFTVTPADTGIPIPIVTGGEPIDSVQCSFCFDQNAQVNIVWIDSVGAGHLYWFDIEEGELRVLDFEQPVTSVAMCLDDKRPKQVGANDMLIWYTVPVGGDHYALYHRLQRDRFAVIYPMADPVWPYIHKLGMNDELRVQISLSTEAPGA